MLTLLSTFSYVLGGRTSALVQSQTRAMKHHKKARCEVYPRTELGRFPVPDEKVPWSEEFSEYNPLDYTAETVQKGPGWADIEVRPSHQNPDCLGMQQQVQSGTAGLQRPGRGLKWNSLDGKINRKSHMGNYAMDDTGCPRNPVGRTGVVGRGLLGRWGPNHAADPIVTRWKRDENGDKVLKDGRPVLQFIAVQRRDNLEWAIPGGMVDAGEVVTMTIKREFGEEALNSLEATREEKKLIEKHINDLFSKGVEVYRGYVDDPRNTDNAWMETIAMNFHDDVGDSVANFKLHAGDDAMGVQWMDLDSSMKLYASHVTFLEETARKLNASW